MDIIGNIICIVLLVIGGLIFFPLIALFIWTTYVNTRREEGLKKAILVTLWVIIVIILGLIGLGERGGGGPY